VETYTTRVENVTYETERVIFIDLSYPEGFSFNAGQYISLEIQRGDTTRYKPYSIYSGPEDEPIRLCIKLVEDGFASERFRHVEEGEVFTMRGPLGRFFPDNSNDEHILLCTGAGIAPLHSMLRDLLDDDTNTVSLYHGVRTRDDLIEPEHYESLQQTYDRFSYYPVCSRSSNAELHGYVQDHMEVREEAAYYLCGVQAFVEDTESILKDNGVSEALIKRERFT
jgi:ferredoxin-NADP reductase